MAERQHWQQQQHGRAGRLPGLCPACGVCVTEQLLKASSAVMAARAAERAQKQAWEGSSYGTHIPTRVRFADSGPTGEAPVWVRAALDAEVAQLMKGLN